MRISRNSSTRHERYHVLSDATLGNGGNRNFVHMKVMVDAGVSCIRGSQKPFAVAGSSRSSFKESALKMRIPSTVPTKSESSMDGDRERHGLFRARPPSGGVSVPIARIIIPQSSDVLWCRVRSSSNTSHLLTDRRLKRPKIDLELLDRSCLDGSVGGSVGNGLKTR